MMQKFTAMLAAFAFAAASLTPATASAQRRHDGWDRSGWNQNCQNDGRRGSCDRYRGDRGRNCANDGRAYSCDRYGRYRDRDDNDNDAVAAGVIGLVLGAVIASAVASSGNNSRAQDDGYYSRDDGYERDYDGYDEPQCTRQERQWDRYANRYVTVEVPC